MKLAIIVTEFPKATETFIYRDLMEFRRQGADLRLYHVAPFRADQQLHSFAEPLMAARQDIAMAGSKALGALAAAMVRHPWRLAKTVGQIVRAYKRHPKIMAKSLALLPKALAIAADARKWGAAHVHAEFAGHPATAAWIGRRFGGPEYSVSCRAHDIFRTQKLLPEKLGEANGVRTVSDFGWDFLREKLPNGRALDIEVIHSSIDTGAITAAPVPIDPAAPRLLYVGALEPKKGVEYLIDALARIDAELGDWNCVLIGSGPSAEALQRRAREAGIAERMDFRGRQDFAAVAEAYAEAQICLCPSIIGPDGRMEGIPNVMIEALAYRRPAIATAISGIPELITDGEHGLLVPQKDAGALGAAILRLVSDPAEAAEMAERGRAKVVDEFDLSRNAARQLALFAGRKG